MMRGRRRLLNAQHFAEAEAFGSTFQPLLVSGLRTAPDMQTQAQPERKNRG